MIFIVRRSPRRLALCLSFALGLLGSGWAVAQKPAQGHAAAGPLAAPSGYRELAWDELVPKDWDPLKQFRDLKLGNLQDNDPEAARLLKRMRAAWDNAPTNPALAGAAVKLPGYLVPLEVTASGGLKEFLLVPYFGACIHSPPPPANQIIHVLLQVPAAGFRAMDTVSVSGILALTRSDNEMGVSGYRLNAAKVEPYVEKARAP